MNCIIIDDDKLARSLLEKYIKRTQTLKLVGSFDNPVESCKVLNGKHSIDLIFLDIMMPEMNGIEILNNIDIHNLQIIVVSGYSGYALETFEYDITDFAVKPLSYDRFFKAVGKAYKRSSQKKPEKFNGKLYIIKDKAFNEVYFDDIIYIDSSPKGVVINTEYDSYTIEISLSNLTKKLPNKLFAQISENTIINCENVSHIEEKMVRVGHTDHEKILPLELISKSELISKINS